MKKIILAFVAALAISCGDNKKEEKTEVKIGTKVEEVTPAETTDDKVAEKGEDYKVEEIPADMKDKFIAHTKMLGGGESDTIEFDAPAPGTYTFMCTFPGHYALMQGKFIVE